MLLMPILASCVALAPCTAPPPTPIRPATDTYHGVTVEDPYRWLENWEDPEVRAWSEAQNAYARSVLDALPAVEQIRARLTELETGMTPEYAHVHPTPAGVFSIKHDPARQQPVLVVTKGIDSLAGERALVDPNTIDPSGGTTIDWFVPSPDGSLVAVSLSEGGSESGTVRVYRTADGVETGDVIPRAHGGTAGGSLAWARDGSGFYYTRYPREGERPADEMDFFVRVFFHALGTPDSADRYETGNDYPKIAEIVLEVSHDGTRVLSSVQNGDGGEFFHELRGPDGTWRRFTTYEDRVVCAALGRDGALYLVSRKDAPRGKVLRLAIPAQGGPDLANAREIIRQHPRLSIETDFFARLGVLPMTTRLFVLYQAGGPNVVHVFTTEGKFLHPVGGTDGVITTNALAPFGEDDVLVSTESYVVPPRWTRYEARTGNPLPTAFEQKCGFEPWMFQTSRFVEARSKDGTLIPVNIISRVGSALDGNNPAILWGYGGYGVSMTPSFSVRRLLFVEQGGVFAIANIRGGGEFGQDWHLQGNLTRKQNVFDDFKAAADWLIAKRYTRRERLAIMGGSNGGLLMGATFTQHPGLCRAVVSSVGIYDMLRVEFSPNGEFNITEFGTVKDPDQFRALHAYSPYHRVRDGQAYPDCLFITGANDPRVDPMQSRKMVARLQAADPRGTFLLRTSANAGHGIGSSLAQRIEQNVDVYAFLFDRLGVTYTPVPPPIPAPAPPPVPADPGAGG